MSRAYASARITVGLGLDLGLGLRLGLHLKKFGGRGGPTPLRIRVSGYAEYKFLLRGIL